MRAASWEVGKRAVSVPSPPGREAGDVEVALGDVGHVAQRDVPRPVAVRGERAGALVDVDVGVDDQQVRQRRAARLRLGLALDGHRPIIAAVVSPYHPGRHGGRAGDPPHRGRPGRALRVPVPARRRGAHAAGGHRAARHARAGHRSVRGRPRPVARRRRRRADLPRRRRSLRRQPRPARRSRRTPACSAARPTARGSSPTRPCWPSNYCWYEAYGFGPSADDVAFLERELGGDAPVDAVLHGGETLRLGPSWRARGPGAARPHAGTPRALGPAQRGRDHHRRGARRRRVRPRRQSPDPAPLLLGRATTRRPSAACARSTRRSCSPRTTT